MRDPTKAAVRGQGKAWFGVLCGGLLALCATGAIAQSYPNKPVKFIFPFSPGGDINYRIIGEKFKERTGQPMVIDYRPGAFNVVGTQALVKSAPDGYTIGYTASSLAANFAFFQLPFTANDFAPITTTSGFPMMVVVHPSSPAQDFKSFLNYAKSRAGNPINYASNSQLYKLALLNAADMAGGQFPFVEIPYKSQNDSLTAVMANQGGDFALTSTSATVIQLIKAGKVRAVAVSSASRMPELADVPTMGEVVPGYSFVGWVGITAPAKVPAPIISFLFKEFTAIIGIPDTAKSLREIGQPPLPSASPEEFGQRFRNEIELYMRLGKNAGITPQPL